MNGLIKTFFGGLFLTVFFSLSAQAATRTVTSAGDGGPGSLREAIQLAAAGDTIDFNIPSCPCVIGLFNPLLINKNLTISGPGANQLTISGRNSVTVFQITGAQRPSVTISDVTIADGRTDRNGGGIFLEFGTLMLSRSVVRNNAAPNTTAQNGFGGGIMAEPGSTLNLLNSTVSNNSSGSGGGGISIRGTVNTPSDLTIVGSTISDNTGRNFGGGVLIGSAVGFFTSLNSDYTNNSARFGGGGIFISGGSAGHIRGGSVSLNDVLVVGGSGSGGGGILNHGSLTMIAVNISNNTADNDGGGGVLNTNDLSLTGCTVAGNQAGVLGGGGISNSAGNGETGRVSIVDSTISGNITTGDGGGIRNYHPTAAPGRLITISNSTISGNRANDGGGFSNDVNGVVDVTSSTIAFNTSTRGGGGISNVVPAATAATLRNTILAGNTAQRGTDGEGPFTSRGFNLIGSDRDIVGFTNGINNDIVGTGNAPVDPLLRPLAANGGPTRTHFPQDTSPVIDKGNPGFGIVTDQRGSIRFFDIGPIPNALGGTGSDIGAVEFQAPTAARVSITGRVLASNGRPVTNTTVALANAAGQTVTARTSSFGYFRFDEIQAGETYVVSINSRRYVFQPQVLSVEDEIAELALIVQAGS